MIIEVLMGGSYSFFFFQAEDGIRDLTVTGVQTCALPISIRNRLAPKAARRATSRCLLAARAKSRLATLAQAISRTTTVAPSSIHKADCTRPYQLSRSGVIFTKDSGG